MKANEAPEKLWWSKGAVWQTNPNSKRYIEYTRTDAFIEKACEWLEEHDTRNYEVFDDFSRTYVVDNQKMIDDFRKALEKGEEA